jgi:hypothetical protein
VRTIKVLNAVKFGMLSAIGPRRSAMKHRDLQSIVSIRGRSGATTAIRGDFVAITRDIDRASARTNSSLATRNIADVRPSR